MLWLTVSKAFFESINRVQTNCLLSSGSSISSISLIIAWAVEKFFKNQTVSGIKYYVYLEITLFFAHTFFNSFV